MMKINTFYSKLTLGKIATHLQTAQHHKTEYNSVAKYKYTNPYTVCIYVVKAK